MKAGEAVSFPAAAEVAVGAALGFHECLARAGVRVLR